MENISPNILSTIPSSCNLSDQYCEILRSLLFEIQNLFGLTSDSISIQSKHEYLEKILDSIEELGGLVNSSVSGAQRAINSFQGKLIPYLCHILQNGVNSKELIADQPQNLEKIVTLLLEGDIALLSEPKIRFQDILEIVYLFVMNDKIRACFNRDQNQAASAENLDKQTQYQEKCKRFSSIIKTQILIINLLTPYFKGYLNDLKFEELILTLIKTLSLEELVNKIQTMVPKDQFIQLRNEILDNMSLKRAVKYIKKCQEDMKEEKKIEAGMCEMKQKLLNDLLQISPDSMDELKKFTYEDLPKDLHRGHIINALEPLIIPKHFAGVRNKINEDKEIKRLTDEISSSMLRLEQIKLESQIQSSFNKYELDKKEEERLDIVLQKLIQECEFDQALTYVNDPIWEPLYKKITNDKELIKSVGELKQLNQNIKERRSPEFELHNQLTNCVNYALKGKFGNKVSPEILIEILKTTGSSEFALLKVQNDVAPLIYNQIKEFLPQEESINNILQKLKEEWLRQCSNDIYTISIADTILQEVSNNNLQIKSITLRETISKLLSSCLDAQSLLKSFTEYIAKQNSNVSMEQLEKVKTEALPRLPKDFKDYYQVKRILENILRSLEVDDELLLIDSAMKLYQTDSLDETINVLESRIPELGSQIREAIYQDLELEEVIFGKLEKNGDSVLSSDIMKMIKEQIEQLAEDYNMQINTNQKLFILQNISTIGFDENWDLTRFGGSERSQIEEIYKDLSVNEDLKGMISILRESFDDILLKQELEKDLKAEIDLKSDELEILIQAILEKGYFDAILEKISDSLNKSSAIKCLEWIEPLLQTKPIYKRKELYSKRLTAWENKVDELMAIIMSQDLDSADSDSDTILDIIEIIKAENLEREELKDIKLMLAKMRPYLESTGLESSIEILFHKDSTTFKVSQDISKAELEKDKDFASLLRYNLRFGFQFRGLTEYFNAHLLKDPKNLEDVFQDYKQYYQMNHLPIDRPESLDYLALAAHDDQLLNLIISLEEAKKMYLGTRDTELLAQIERDIAPKVYAKSEKLYDLWIANNKGLAIKRAEVPFSDFVLYPKVLLEKSLELVSQIKLSKLDLRSFNQVTFRISQEEQEELIKNWISNLGDFQNFQNLLPIYFNLLKRGEDWRTFVDKVSSSMVENNLSTKFGFFDKKFLFYLLFTAGDTELQAKTLELFGRYNPIPLRYPKWNDLANNPEAMKYAFNDLIYYIMQPSLGIMSLALGKRASLPIGKSEILNKVFKKNFSINESANPFHVNTIDVDFDCSFRPYRNFCIADAHGNFPFGELSHYCEMFKILIVHIHYEDLVENRITDDDLLKLANQNLRWKESILVLIRDIPNDNDTCIEKDESRLISLCPQLGNLSIYLSEGTFQLIGLTKLTELDSNNLTAIMQKLQTLIFGTIQPFRDEITITKNSFIKLMQNWQSNSSVILVDNSVSKAMREVEKYEKDSDFFDEKIFPYRDHLAQLRKVESILRNATTENELMEAQWRHSALQKKLENGKPTRILEIFCDLLNQEESHLVIMELASQIKDFVSRKTKYYKQIKEDLIKSIAFNELNDKNKEGEELEQHKEMLQAQKEELERINDKLFKKSLSIEVIWRELMAVYTYNPKTAEHLLKFDFIISKVQEFLEKGESFELVDGDNLQFNENLLVNLMKKIKGKMFNICVLGPQSSGKSTLLNYLFGSQFLSSVGRCTRGAYLSLLTVPNNSNYQYIMILDTEGLQSTEKNDKEFDRRIALFCLAISHITIVNVKGDLHLQMKCLLESSALSLHSLNKNKIKKPSIYFVFNQNPPTKDKSPFMTQISSMMNTILSVNPEAGDAAEIFRSNSDKLHVLSFAFSTMKEEKNLNKNIWQDWEYILPESSFASECAKLAADINGEMDKLMKDSSQSYSQQTFYQFKDWLEMTIQVWKSISIFPSLVEFLRVESYKQDRELVQHCENIIQKKQSRLNGEEIVQEYFGSTLGCKDPKKLIVLIEKSELLTNIGKIKDHYMIIQNQMNSELAAVKEAEKYEYELAKKHEKIMTGIVQFSEQEAIFVLKREMLKVLYEAQNAQNEWGVGELYLKVFENDCILDFESHQEILFGVISGLYHRFVCFPHLGTAYTKLFQQELSNIYVEKNVEWDDFEPFLKSFKKELLLGDNEIYCWNDTTGNPNFAQNYTKKLEGKCNFVDLAKACPVSLKIEHVETQQIENNFEVDQLISRDSFLEVFKDIPILSVEKKFDPEIQSPKRIIKDFLDANKNYTILEPCQVIIKGVCEFDVDEQSDWKNMDPQNVKITVNPNDLQFILKKETDWDKLFFDIYQSTTSEIIRFKTLQKQHGNKDQDHSCFSISSVLLDLIKSVFDQVNKIIEVYNQDISRISQTLDMYGRGIVHLFATLILWKLLCHQEQAVLVDLIRKIDEAQM